MKIDNLDEKLIKAVEKGNLGTAFEMLKRGANPDADKGMPLYLAIKQKNANMIQLLLNSGASIIESSERLQTLQNDKNYQKNKNEINLLKLYKEKKYNIKEDIHVCPVCSSSEYITSSGFCVKCKKKVL